jgi:two-component sensor histidine kinase
MQARFATTIGLLVNEIVSNAYKHAFHQRSEGCLRIDFVSKGEYIKLRISDDGPGQSKENNQKESLGHILIEEFAQQLGAEMEISRNSGTTYLISFKKSNIGL